MTGRPGPESRTAPAPIPTAQLRRGGPAAALLSPARVPAAPPAALLSPARVPAAPPAALLSPARFPAGALAAAAALLLLAAAAGCAVPPERRLAAHIAVGAFSGPGGDRLAAELEARSSPDGVRSLVLSGSTSFDSGLSSGSERVLDPPRSQNGPGEALGEAPGDGLGDAPGGPDGPAGPWVERTVPFSALTATLAADWTLADPATGAVARRGATSDTLRRVAGGWLAGQGAAPAEPPSESEALDLLAAALAEQLIEELGPELGASALARAGDERSRRALDLAASGRWEEAAALWLELVGLNPEYTPALYNLGLHHERLGELEAAWSWYRRAYLAESAPLHREALTRITDTLDRLGRPPRGVRNPLDD